MDGGSGVGPARVDVCQVGVGFEFIIMHNGRGAGKCGGQRDAPFDGHTPDQETTMSSSAESHTSTLEQWTQAAARPAPTQST